MAAAASSSSDDEDWMPFPAHEDGDPRSLAPFETTPLLRVEESVAMASITEADVVCDLGCGNARLLLHLHSLTGARCVGYEINPEQIEAARAAIAAAGAGGSVSIVDCDLREADLSPFTVIFTWLQPWAVPQLQDAFRAAILERDVRMLSYMWQYEPLTKGGLISVEVGASKQVFCYRRVGTAQAASEAGDGRTGATTAASAGPGST